MGQGEGERQSTRIDDICLEAADEILEKLAALKRERATLVNLARERVRAGLPLNTPALLAQAQRVNRLMEEESLRELFAFLRTSPWAQRRFDAAEFRGAPLVTASLLRRQTEIFTLARREYRVTHSAAFARLMAAINTA
jgi:hypothetical protein